MNNNLVELAPDLAEIQDIAVETGLYQNIPDTPDGFALFFSMIARDPDTGVPLRLTKHAREWIEFVYHCKEEDKGAVIEAFRGAGKSVVMTAFVAWRIGHEPSKTHMIVRSAFNAAQDTGATIANIIDKNKNWRLFFPHVIPDKESSWSILNGYNVRDTSMHEGQWAQIRAARGASKTLMVFPYTSGNIIGRRVSGIILIDDIHDDDNVESPAELQKVIRTWNDTIARTRLPDCWTVFIGTPWTPDDLLQELKRRPKVYLSMQTPVHAPDGIPTWPEMFDEDGIQKLIDEDITGGPGFARMYLLDLSAAVSRLFTYMEFDHERVSNVWKRRAGMDYASIEGGGNTKFRSHAALANVANNPVTKDWVVSEGYVGQIPQSLAEKWVINNQNQFPNLEFTVVETDGKGAEFLAVLNRNKGLRLVAEKTGGRNKAMRIESGLEPLLRTGQLKVSSAQTPFLNTLREFLNMYPNVNRYHPGWDIMDAIYWACFHMMQTGDMLARHKKTEKKKNPFYALAQME